MIEKFGNFHTLICTLRSRIIVQSRYNSSEPQSNPLLKTIKMWISFHWQHWNFASAVAFCNPPSFSSWSEGEKSTEFSLHFLMCVSRFLNNTFMTKSRWSSAYVLFWRWAQTVNATWRAAALYEAKALFMGHCNLRDQKHQVIKHFYSSEKKSGRRVRVGRVRFEM